MARWLMKSEPDVFSIDDLKHRERETWDGVRNYLARNHLRAMAVGDEVLFYHSSCAVPGVVGIARVARAAFPDPTQFDPASEYHDPASKSENPRWSAVEVGFVRKFKAVLTLDALKAMPELAGLALVQRGSRLSVMPVDELQWRAIVGLAE